MTTTETAKARKTPKTAKTDTTPYMSLEDVLEEIGRRGRVTSAVVLTYEFDPELVRSLARNGFLAFDEEASDASGPFLCWTAAFPAALFYDARRARSLARTPGNFETHFVARNARAAHHSKAYAFATEDGAFELVLGSFNFTHSGLRTNREVLLRFTLPPWIDPNSPKDAAALALHREWRDFLQATYAEKATSDALTDYLGALDARLRAEEGAISPDAFEKEAHRTVRLIASGYDERAGYGRKNNRPPRFERYRRTGLEVLADYARELDFHPTRMLVVSPFFDAGKRSVALEHFAGTKGFPTLREVSMVSDAKSWNASFLSVGILDVRCFTVPNTISKDEAEALDRGTGRSGRTSVGLAKAIEKKRTFGRALHAKVIVLVDDAGRALIYAGSANFTANAWLGKNAELGVAGFVEAGWIPMGKDRPAEDWDRTVVRALLGVEVTEARIDANAPADVATEPEEDHLSTSPLRWLESVTLEPEPESLENSGNSENSVASDQQDLSETTRDFPVRFRFALRDGASVDLQPETAPKEKDASMDGRSPSYSIGTIGSNASIASNAPKTDRTSCKTGCLGHLGNLGRFVFEGLDVTPRRRSTLDGREVLLSLPLRFEDVRKRLAGGRVLEWTRCEGTFSGAFEASSSLTSPDVLDPLRAGEALEAVETVHAVEAVDPAAPDSASPDRRYIPFNIAREVGIPAEFAACVGVETTDALDFLFDLCAGRRPAVSVREEDETKTAAGQDATDDAGLPVGDRHFISDDEDADDLPSLTHAVQAWLAGFGRLEAVLFPTGSEAPPMPSATPPRASSRAPSRASSRTNVRTSLRSDLFAYFDVYAKRLAEPDARLGGRVLADRPKAFVLAELLLLVARVARVAEEVVRAADLPEGLPARFEDRPEVRSEVRSAVRDEDRARILSMRMLVAKVFERLRVGPNPTLLDQKVEAGYFAMIDEALSRAGILPVTTSNEEAS